MNLEENKISITIQRDEVLRHVQDTAWLLAKSTASKSENPDKEDNYLMDVFKETFDGDGNDELATRFMTDAFNYAATFFKEHVYDYIDASTEKDNVLSKPTSYTLTAYVPDTHESDIEHLTSLIHKLVAADVLYNWCLVVAPEYIERVTTIKADAETRLAEKRYMFTNRRRPGKRGVTYSKTSVQIKKTYTLTIGTDPDDETGGTAEGGGMYEYGKTATLVATPSTGYDFVGWQDEDGTIISTNSTLIVKVTSSAKLTAVFKLKTFTVSVSAGDSTLCSVTGGGIYNYGVTAKVTATVAEGYTFSGWYKADGTAIVSDKTEYEFTVTDNVSLKALGVPTPTTPETSDQTGDQ